MRYSQSSVCGSLATIMAYATLGGAISVVVRMLVADDLIKFVRAVILQRGLARHVGDRHHPAEPGFGAELLGRYQLVGAVERTGHDLDPRTIAAVDVSEGRERRAGRLLAHPAVTDADLHRRRRQGEANGAALAAAGQNGF